MSKRKLGEHKLGWKALQRMMEYQVAEMLAAHYEELAQQHRRRAVSAQAEMWQAVYDDAPPPKVPYVGHVRHDLGIVTYERRKAGDETHTNMRTVKEGVMP